jgi:spore maturation protein CgeB
MRILSVVGKQYYGRSDAVEPMYLEFTDPLIDMGHTVDHFDHAELSQEYGFIGCGERFVDQVKKNRYDAVLYQTAGIDRMDRNAIREAGNYAPIVAWNSDDDWQWESYSRHLIKYFTFMITTYPHVYEANRDRHKNLLLSQWGCYSRYADFGRRKDLDFTFAGLFYGNRVQECRYLQKAAGLEVFGLGSGMVRHKYIFYFHRLRALASRRATLYGLPLNYNDVNAIWNRSRISYTPMGASVDPNKNLQIKSRAFEMGLSGTMMICQQPPFFERYYEPGKEFIPIYHVEDCVGKVKHYLKHEADRYRIAEAYYKRTQAEHLWQHRFQQIFSDIGL